MTSEKPKVMFLINALALGGGERVLMRDANELAARGYDVYFGCLYPNRYDADRLPPLELSPDHIICFNFNGPYSLQGYRRLATFLNAHSIDVLYSTLDDANIVARVSKLFRPRTRVFVREANVAQIKTWKLKLADIFLNFLSTKIIACSPLVKKTLIPYQPFHAGKMVVLENGVDIPPEMPSRPPKDEVKFLTVGSIEVRKRHLFILRSLLHLKETALKWKFYIIGGGSKEGELREFIQANGLAERVILTGVKTKQEVAEYYRSADIFVFTPEWEGGPNVVLEAMSYGLPCVVTKFVGEEKITDGVEGYLVEYGNEKILADRIGILARDPGLRQSMGQKGRELVIRENSMEAHTRTLREILEM